MKSDSFSSSARTALILAYSSAKRMGHSCIGSEHILLGLVCEGGGKAFKVLLDEGVTGEVVSAAIEESLGSGKGDSTQSVYLGQEALDIIQAAAEKAYASAVSDVHLLMAILEYPECAAFGILAKAGVDSIKICVRLSGYDTVKKEKTELKLTLQHGVDMTQKARRGEYDPVLGRDTELDRVINILSRRMKSNPLLLGEAGVGKTAVVEELARRIASGLVPLSLKNTTVISLDVPSAVSGTKYRGEFEDKMRKILGEVKNAGNVILFIDEIHTICGAGAAEGAIDGANILKPSLARGEIKIIGATTHREYKKYICRDGAFARRFQTVDIKEPSIQQTQNILMGLKPIYEQFHRVEIADSLIGRVVELSERYIPERHLPDKAIDLFDEAMAYAASKGQKQVENEALLTCISNMTGISAPHLEGKSQDVTMAQRLKEKVIGQDKAVDALCSAYISGKITGIDEKVRGAFLFCGPTGVGKTLLAKEFAKEISGRKNNLLRFDMSEYMEKHSVSRLIGAPPGYSGYGEGGLLTEGARKYRDGVILFDEVEKAHPEILNLLLQILDEGKLSDSMGQEADFRSNIIIMTSNARVEKEVKTVGFGEEKDDEQARLKELKKMFSPELLSRIDEIIVFKSLKKDELEAIAKRELEGISCALAKEKISLVFDEKLPATIAEMCIKNKKSPREMRNILLKNTRNALMSKMSNSDFESSVFLPVPCEISQICNTC